ncbi:hypothetical protein CC78DRAFT_608859 [Lojkania enalia]|uniref:DUF3176 domain containing protein n=1 Tax=Lojkania enalia TaxID=147567 RepID=A0A9P4K7P6_9PLEO|nr:hypothetical protein CC78DRAFT_608859 [Didymosphaeria enalia]
MSSQFKTSRWPKYPSIPIFLDTSGNRIMPTGNGTGGHYLKTPSPNTSSPQRNIRFCTLATPSDPKGQFLRVPTPAASTMHSRSLSDERSPIYSHTACQPPSQWQSQSNTGLGILNAPMNPHIIYPSKGNENDNSSDNLAQKIEARLWRFNKSDNVVARWVLEIISWLISAICMGAIVTVLVYLKDKRLPSWPLDLTLNAYIATLSRIASAALVLPVSEGLGQLKWIWFQGHSKKMWDFEIFDNASRGPWGALLLLIRTKCRTIAALGASVMLLALALDPFFQQVVDFPERWTLQGPSSLPKIVRYEPGYSTMFRGMSRVLRPDPVIQRVAEQFFFENGTRPVLFGNGTRPDFPLYCPTSNCTWPIYQTLGICSACEEVPQLLKFACLNTSMDWSSNFSELGASKDYPVGPMCGYFLNSTDEIEVPMLMSGYKLNPVNFSAEDVLLMRTQPLVTYPERKPIFGGSINFRHLRNPIVDFLIVGASNGAEGVYRNETPTAHECVLSWCVKTIKSSYYWSNYSEEVISTFLNKTMGPYPWLTSYIESPNINGTRTVYLQNITLDDPFDGNETMRYGVGNTTALETIVVFDDILPAYAAARNASSIPMLVSQINPNANYAPLTRNFGYNPWIAPNNVTRHVENLATALTNVIRSSSSNQTVTGNAYDRETYVSVRWAWLSLPLTLLFMSFIFLIATVMKSSREKGEVGIWKTSAVATLLYGLPDDVQRKINASTFMGTPRTKAKFLRVKLLPKKGWRTSGNMISPLTPEFRQYKPAPGWI